MPSLVPNVSCFCRAQNACSTASGRGLILYPESFRVRQKQWHGNQCEIFDVRLEEIAQADERLDGLDICWWFGILGGLELIFPWFDSLGHQAEAELGDFIVS